MMIDDLIKLEYASLRSELDHTKNYQLTLLAWSFAATGVILGLAPFLESLYRCVICILPVALLLGVTKLYMEKAKTICTIVGYLRILEKIMIRDEALIASFIGWENALKDFRHHNLQVTRSFWTGRHAKSKKDADDNQNTKNKKNAKDNLTSSLQNTKSEILKFKKSFHLMPDLYVLILATTIVFILSSLILGISYSAIVWSLGSIFWLVFLAFLVIVIFFIYRLLCEACHIVYGDYSYNKNECTWNRVICEGKKQQGND